MAQWRITDNTRETFVGANSATITLGGAAQFSRSFAGASWASGDFGPIVARAGAEIAAGIFTYNGSAFTQTTPIYTSNGNSAVTFSSGAQGEVYCDVLSAWVELINFTEIGVASASTCDIGGTAVQGAKVVISGTTTITSLGTGSNKFRLVRFSGALTLTHNATSLILPGAANITTAAGDTAIFASDSSGNWRCYSYQRAAGLPVVVIKPPQKFTASGTYTPDPNLLYAIIECVGGGGGGGSSAGTASQIFSGGGGGGGGYSRLVATKATIGASQTVTIGAGGAGGASGSNNGAAGGDTSVGSLCIGKGGSGGLYGSVAQVGTGGAGGVAGTGDLARAGYPGGSGVYITNNTTYVQTNFGGNTPFAGGAVAPAASGGAAVAGNAAAANSGGGGSGAITNVAGNAAGGNGGSGIVFITEHCSQ